MFIVIKRRNLKKSTFGSDRFATQNFGVYFLSIGHNLKSNIFFKDDLTCS
jgi:hypothetical protein